MDELVPKEDQPASMQADQLVPPEDQPQTDALVPPEDQPIEAQNQNKYGTTSQQIITGLEGAAQGVAGPLATLAETKLLGVKPEDIVGRKEANPWTHGLSETAGLVGGTMLGTGEGALIAKAIPEFARLGTIGSAALRGGLEMAALQGSDEISNAILKPHDPETTASNALAHMAYAGIMGTATGSLFGATNLGVNKTLKEIADKDLVTKAKSFLSGYGAAAEGRAAPKLDPFIKQYIDEGGEEMDKAAWAAGHKLQQDLPSILAKKGIDYTIEGTGALKGGLGGYYASKKVLEPIAEKILQRPLTAASKKIVMPVLNKILMSNAAASAPAAIEYALKAAKGQNKITAGMNMLFKGGGQQLLDAGVNDKQRNAIMDGIDNNILDEQIQNTKAESPIGMAEGGEVTSHTDHFAEQFPQDNQILQAAKSRVYNYLKTLKPQPQQNSLPFDENEIPHEVKRNYDKAVDFAANPLTILHKIKDGTISSPDMTHMTQMWPELTDHLRKEATKHITEMQIKKEKPSHQVRQGLSLFMGTPLDSTMAPTAILAAQSTFQPQAPGRTQQPSKAKKQSLNKGPNLYRTDTQAAESDRSSRD